MGKQSDKQRIVALQKALRLARPILEGRANYDAAAEKALYEINKLDWNSKPTGLQGLVGHGEYVR